jgi:hypothetical protein
MPGLPGALRLPVVPLILAAAPAAAQEAPPALDPQAIAILQNAADYLAGQEKISVTWFVSFDEVIDGREKLTRTRSGDTLLARGEGFYARTDNGSDTRVHYFDGSSYYIADAEENAYVLAPHNGSFDSLVRRIRAEYGAPLPVWSVLSSQARAELIGSATAVAYVGETRIAGRAAHHMALSNYDEDWQIWVAADEAAPELLMLIGTDPYTQGWPQYRVFFSNWEFDPEIPEGLFTYVPDDTAERMVWPKTVPQAGPADE